MKPVPFAAFVFLALSVAAPPASAMLRTGFHVGIDRNGHDAYREIFDGDLGESESISIFSHNLDDPLLGGVQLLVDALPFVDFEFGLEGSYAKYSFEYLSGSSQSFQQDVGFGRLSLYASGKFNYISLPMVRLYIGGGVGYHQITPLFGEKLVLQQLQQQGSYELNLSNILARKSHFGAHALGGILLRPAFLPFSLDMEARYFMLPVNEFGDDTSKFLSWTLGLYFGA